MTQQEPTRDTFAPPLDLSTPHAWRVLGRAHRRAHADDQGALDAFEAAERAADTPGAPNVKAADERQRETAAQRRGLVRAALAASAPDRPALALKLDMISDEGGWNDFDDATWPLFVADLRRLCGLSLEPSQ
ncbi:MAG TPA: hypothetical protein VEA80_04825 [Vitreimonas sp.]|uniref:hypothetical protein n=1 Tax=Vitreimonas sp. TaxID=3069702 RepID=UPI002D41EF9C|nr:hypothetical protein [Vitreimonas sp.]HYD86775.1 hypothetical protein [Vitreimonas sp.]